MYRIEDPRAAQESNYQELLRAKASAAIVNLVATRTFEEFMSERPAVEAALLASLTSAIGGCVIEGLCRHAGDAAAGAPGVIRSAARKLESLATLERATEQAALRALAHSARMLTGNPELMNLRVLQALSAPGSRDNPCW
jgi:hypothetical protein